MKITRIEGIGSVYARHLNEEGIRTTEMLLKNAATRSGRKKLAEKMGIPEKTILNWVNRADLMRVKGVGEEYSDLLEAAGVDTVRELGTRRPENLYKKMLDINNQKKLVRRVPPLKLVERWVVNAKDLVPLITH